MAGPVRISILANGRQARAEATKTAAAYGGLGRSLVKGGAALGLAGLTAKAVQFAGASVGLEAKFSQTMSLIGAATKAPASAIDGMSKLALKLGADTSFSANEAADAMLELAKSGLTTSQIMGGGVQATLQLAAAGGTDLGTAATIASNAMNAFSIKGSDAASVAAALAGGANASSASVESLGQGLSQVGPGAVNAGLSLQETVAALSAFDAAGVKGSDAGTSLKTMLTRLVPQTEKAATAMSDLGLDFTKANGEFVPLTNVAEQLKTKLAGLTEEQRTTALATIFGSDATRAATVLYREGAGGLQKYIKATNDQGAAQELAEARMSGTAGTLERLSGSVETAQLRLGQELAPVVQKVGGALAERLVPAMDDTIAAVKVLGGALAPVVPVLKGLGEVVVGTAGFIKGLPGPVKELGIQAGIAALILPRLAAGVGAFATRAQNGAIYARVLGAELRDSATRGAVLQSGLARLAGASRNLAGVGGLTALAASSQSTNQELKLLGTVAGATALGFSLGGPWGAAAGAIGGVGVGLYRYAGAAGEADRATAALKEQQKQAAAAAKNYTGTLDATTGAISRATRQQILDNAAKSGALATAAKLDVTTQDVIGSVLGQEGATRRLSKAFRDNGQSLNLVEYGKFKTFLQENTAALSQQQNAVRQNTRDVQSLGENLRGVPKDVVARVRTLGASLSQRELRNLKAEFPGLTNKQLRIITSALRVEPTRRQLRGLRTDAERAGNVRPNLNPFVGAYTQGVNRARGRVRGANLTGALRNTGRGGVPNLNPFVGAFSAGMGRARNQLRGSGIPAALKNTTRGARADLGPFVNSVQSGSRRAAAAGRRGGGDVRKGLEVGPRGARANLSAYQSSISTGVAAARGTASAGGNGVGAALKAGVIAGFSGTGSILAAQAAGAVRGAIAAARAAGKVRSPSRETRYIGEMLGEGLNVGMRRKKNGAKKAGRELALAALSGVKNGSQGVDKSIEQLTKMVQQKINLKDDKKESAREKAVLKSLKGQFAQLKLNGKAQDRIAASLQTQKETLKGLVDAGKEYANGIKQQAVDYGSVVGLGTIGGGAKVTADRIVSQLTARAKAAADYAATVQGLAKAGLNQTTVQQLLDAGVEGGLATAEALRIGGAATLQQVNALTTQIAGTGATLGEQMRARYLQAGIAAQQGIVDGLTRNERALDQAAQRIANTLTKSVKKALGIKSPSTVFKAIGEQTVTGLDIGLDETHVRRAGARTAKAVVTGFGTPALDATMAAPGPTAAGTAFSVRVTLSAQQVSQLQRGREVQADLDAYYQAGGASKVKRR